MRYHGWVAPLAFVFLTASPSFAVNGNIGIYADMGQAIYNADLGFQTPLRLYVYALLQGGSLPGITGAEYQITRSFSTDWTYIEDFSPAGSAITLGSGALTGPLPGINVVWNTCQTDHSVLIETIDVIDLTGLFAGQLVFLTVEGHTSPGNPFFRCPLFTLCDDPIFTKVCLGQNIDTVVCPFPPNALACFTSTSGEFRINSYVPQAVDNKTWSEMKNLYQ